MSDPERQFDDPKKRRPRRYTDVARMLGMLITTLTILTGCFQDSLPKHPLFIELQPELATNMSSCERKVLEKMKRIDGEMHQIMYVMAFSYSLHAFTAVESAPPNSLYPADYMLKSLVSIKTLSKCRAKELAERCILVCEPKGDNLKYWAMMAEVLTEHCVS